MGNRPEGMTADPSPGEIREEIEQTRAEMSETIDAIQEKLRPGNLVSEAAGKAKTATVERVKQMAHSAGETASGYLADTREAARDFMEGARGNPIPAALIGIGAAWLVMNQWRSSDQSRRYSANRSRARDLYDRGAGQYEPSTYDRGEYEWSPATGSNRETWTEQAQNLASEAGDRARTATRRAQNGLQHLMDRNPLLVGAAAVAIGAAIGYALPETQTENDWMGETRDSVVERAQAAARTAVDQVKTSANEAVDAVDRVVDRAVKPE
jgi:ElaB/YqjD/DUF883 family membrane-anchored ribosome-binding protein